MNDNLPTDPPTPPRPARWRWSRSEKCAGQSGQPTPATGKATAAEVEPRCEAAHPDDRSACVGSPYSVEVINRFGHPAYGCVWHGSILFASLSQALMYPAQEDPAAVQVLRSLAPQLRNVFLGYLHHDPDARSQP